LDNRVSEPGFEALAEPSTKADDATAATTPTTTILRTTMTRPRLSRVRRVSGLPTKLPAKRAAEEVSSD
jgi:hypothetical protein